VVIAKIDPFTNVRMVRIQNGLHIHLINLNAIEYAKYLPEENRLILRFISGRDVAIAGDDATRIKDLIFPADPEDVHVTKLPKLKKPTKTT